MLKDIYTHNIDLYMCYRNIMRRYEIKHLQGYSIRTWERKICACCSSVFAWLTSCSESTVIGANVDAVNRTAVASASVSVALPADDWAAEVTCAWMADTRSMNCWSSVTLWTVLRWVLRLFWAVWWKISQIYIQCKTWKICVVMLIQ